jgi:hypothetical protein
MALTCSARTAAAAGAAWWPRSIVAWTRRYAMKGSRAEVGMARRPPADGLRGGYCRSPWKLERRPANIRELDVTMSPKAWCLSCRRAPRHRSSPGLLARLRAQGWRLEPTRKGLMDYSPDGSTKVLMHHTPSDRRAYQNILALLKKGAFNRDHPPACLDG